MSGQRMTVLVKAQAERERVAATCQAGTVARCPNPRRTTCLRVREFYRIKLPKRCFVSIVFVAIAASTLPMAAQAGPGHASFQVTLRIVARQPAPRVIEQSVSTTSPDFPPYRVSEGRVVTRENSGRDIIVLETEF